MSRPLELLTVAEMADADRLSAIAGTSGLRLMEAAGQAIAEVCLRRAGSGRRVTILCGPGNNGGDGYVAARRLRDEGCSVTVVSLESVAALRGDAQISAARWNGAVIASEQIDWRGTDLFVDALFGAGLTRPIEGAYAPLVDTLNGCGKPIVAVDVPSGVEGDSGCVAGPAVRASETVTFFRLKPGHLLQPGRDLCGLVTLADIGIMNDVLREILPLTVANEPELWRDVFPWPKGAGHKYTRGHALVVSGAMPTLGAARLSARGAARIGAGLVTVASPPDAVAAHAAHLTSIMLRPFDGATGLADILTDARKNVVVLGPGLGVGPQTRALVEVALRRPRDGDSRAVVLDADALTSFSGDVPALAALIAHAKGPVVLTPHDGEFVRLFGSSGEGFSAPSKLVRACAAARLLGAVLLFKGSDTVVAMPDGRASIAAADAPWLATAGSGDVLAGMISGLLAQRMPAFEAVCAAVWLHAAAARRFGPGLIAEDLPETLPAVLRDLFEA